MDIFVICRSLPRAALLGPLWLAAPLRAQQSLAAPEIFAPGVVSGVANAGSPAFAPDGRTMFFTRTGAGWGVIVESHRASGGWSTPTVAPFSGRWNDMMPAMAPDGSYIVFVSSRPVADTANAPRVANLYRTTRTDRGWSEPVRLPDAVNIMPRIFRPTVASDGTIYFMGMTISNGSRRMGLYRAKAAAGSYQRAEPLSFSDSTHNDVDPEIAPDQSYLIFSSADRGVAGDSHERLYVSTRQGDGWGPIAPLHYDGDTINGSSDDNEARLSPDRRTLYFTSNRSIPVHFPRSAAQAAEDLKRLSGWDNGNSNVWSVPFHLAPKPMG